MLLNSLRLERIRDLNRIALYAALYGSERVLQQAIDDEGCSIVFASLKLDNWQAGQ